MTALHLAARDGHAEMARWLLNLGVDKAVVRKLGRWDDEEASGTASQISRASGYAETAEAIDSYVPGKSCLDWKVTSHVPVESESEVGSIRRNGDVASTSFDIATGRNRIDAHY